VLGCVPPPRVRAAPLPCPFLMAPLPPSTRQPQPGQPFPIIGQPGGAVPLPGSLVVIVVIVVEAVAVPPPGGAAWWGSLVVRLSSGQPGVRELLTWCRSPEPQPGAAERGTGTCGNPGHGAHRAGHRGSPRAQLSHPGRPGSSHPVGRARLCHRVSARPARLSHLVPRAALSHRPQGAV